MAEDSAIQWTTHTFNGWVGCERVSAGCKHCYAAVSAPARLARANGLELWGPADTTPRNRTSEGNWRLPERWNRAAERSGQRAYVFASSLCDVFEDHPSVAPWRAELFALIERTPRLTWQLLTKRPENLLRFLPPTWLEQPRANVWLGTTVEDQRAANERIPELLRAPAVVRFLSCEPLVEAVSLTELQVDCRGGVESWDALRREYDDELGADGSRIDWVIVGGESGPRARPFDLAWARAIVEQCRSANVACFVKQLGAEPVDGDAMCKCGHTLTGHWLPFPAPCRHGHRPLPTTPCEAVRLAMTPEPDGACSCIGFSPKDRHPQLALRDSHGGDPSEWPEDLRVREMPALGGA
jgi:protein gp37